MKKLVTGALLTLIMSSFSLINKFGLDAYDISLNNKILMKGYVNQPLDARVLVLDKPVGQLGVVYRHCRLNNGPGSGRSMTLKDETGSVVRKWDFADNQSMNIPVKDLQQKGHQVSLYYKAHELDKDELLAMIRFK